MVPEPPLSELNLYARSISEAAGFAALADISSLTGPATPVRLIGGLMVSLHVQRWKLPKLLERFTLDADIGVPPAVVKDGNLLRGLLALGYVRTSGCRYERMLGAERAVIDVLVPAYTSRARASVVVGDLTTTEVPGLAEALRDPGITVDLRMRDTRGVETSARVVLPDEKRTLVLKALAWRARMHSNDAVDMWRCLEVCSVAGAKPIDFSNDAAAQTSMAQAFVDQAGSAMQYIAASGQLSGQAATHRWTRIRALIAQVVG